MSFKHRKKAEALEEKILENSSHPTTEKDQQSLQRLEKFRDGEKRFKEQEARRIADQIGQQAALNDNNITSNNN